MMVHLSICWLQLILEFNRTLVIIFLLLSSIPI